MTWQRGEIEKWIAYGKRCRKCGRTNHKQDACTLKKGCSECQEVHLRVLHTITKPGPRVYLITPEDRASLANSKQGGKVYLKVVPIIISHGSKSLHTYAILDDEAECKIILPAAVRHLELKGRISRSADDPPRRGSPHWCVGQLPCGLPCTAFRTAPG